VRATGAARPADRRAARARCRTPTASFDLVLLIDVLEHVRERRPMGRRSCGCSSAGGIAFITTPARLRYFNRPDPHYGVRACSRCRTSRSGSSSTAILGMRTATTQGTSVPAYDVEHTFWHYREIARLFPGRDVGRAACSGFPMGGGPLFSRAVAAAEAAGVLVPPRGNSERAA
jgi:hypothetical protein